MPKLDKITIRGFKSIESLEDFKLGNLNVLIGANGAGKSNFVEFFRLLCAIVEQRLQTYSKKNGPSDGWFFDGPKVTKLIEADLRFGDNRYAFGLEPTDESGVLIAKEQIQYVPSGGLRTIAEGVTESRLATKKGNSGVSGSKHGVEYYVHEAISSWQVYHFHDTSMTAGMRRPVGVEQSEALAPDASNLAAFLLALRENHPDRYQLLRKTIQRIAPYFDDFTLKVSKRTTEDQVRLTWKQKDKKYVFSSGHFSDGTIRFICLATVLMQPSPPQTIVLDEPELGLHPEALLILGGLLRSAATRMQIIVATQSPVLLNEFGAKEIITVDQADGASTFNRLKDSELEKWLEEFTIGELWQKGTIRGGVNNA